MKKRYTERHTVLFAAVMLCVALTACGGRTEKAEETAAAEQTVRESKTEEKMSLSGSDETRITVYENNVFRAEFRDGQFAIDESRIDEDIVSFKYTGEAEHPVTLTVSFKAGRDEAEIIEEAGMITDDSRIVVNDRSNVSFWDEEVSLIQKETIAPDGITCYSTLYVFPYAKGSMCVSIEDYFEENNDAAMGIAGAMEMLVNTLSFNKAADDAVDMDGMDELSDSGEITGMANPWSYGTRAEIEAETGLSLGIPDRAENVSFAMLKEEMLEQMTFEIDGVRYCARVKAAADAEDISGIYADWEKEESSTVGYCDAVIRTAYSGGEKTEECSWFDIAPGVMYSLSAQSEKAADTQLQTVAEQVFAPLQGDVG